MISYDAIKSILGIKEKVTLTPEEMAKILNITIFPFDPAKTDPKLVDFSNRVLLAFKNVGVNIVPYEKAIELMWLRHTVKRFFRVIAGNAIYTFNHLSRRPQKTHFITAKVAFKFLQRKRIKKGISVLVVGEQDISNLPMDYIYSFKDNSVITILPFPPSLSESSEFNEHFDTALSMFAHNMTNIVLAVDSVKWMVYNFNASHPIYAYDKDFDDHILAALIPKIVAPISPHKFKDFILLKEKFNPDDEKHSMLIDDIVDGALLFDKTNLYPAGKKIDDLPFRSDFHRFIGKLHLDNRNGMSYGFIARQMPTPRARVYIDKKIEEVFGNSIPFDKDYFLFDGKLHILIELQKRKLCVEVPEVWVLTQRSGSNKTNVNRHKDLLKMGIANGQMYIQAPNGVVLDHEYRPSFDTKVILAHAVGNAIISSISEALHLNHKFTQNVEKSGLALAHWHGYIRPDLIPSGIITHGYDRPHVACSSPQSAIYALRGKLDAFEVSAATANEFVGDIHIEPHHGSNVNFTSVKELANLLVSNPEMSVLGNKYLNLYFSSKIK